MGSASTQLLILLHSVPEIGEKSLCRLLELLAQHRLSDEEFLRLDYSALRRRFALSSKAAEFLFENRCALEAAAAEKLRLFQRCGVNLLTKDGAAYPDRLIHRDESPPPLLYTLGRAGLLTATGEADPSEPFTFTIALSNGAESALMARMEELAAKLASVGGIVITGHDRPAYQNLALAAQRLDRPAIYVLDRGLREALGPELDRPLFAAARIRDFSFAAERDLVLSPFRPDDHSIGSNNRRRDRLIFALADLIIALDVRPGGVMEGECAHACSRGRPVFVAESASSAGGRLQEAGAFLLPESADQITLLREAAIQARFE